MDLRKKIADAIEGIFAEVDSASTLDGGYVELVERAVRNDGTIPVKLIQPGWGSSGYYSAEVLERDGPLVFPSGTQMFWNHDTWTEEMERPEGNLNSLAGVFVSDAVYMNDGVAGPGLYADAKVTEAYQDAVNDLAPHIGVSIRASGTATEGEAEGRSGAIVQSLDFGRSVDFVTKPGAGGKIIEMFESARSKNRTSNFREGGTDYREVETMPTEEQFSELREALDAQSERTTALEESLAASQTEAANLRSQLIQRDANDIVLAALAESDLPVAAQKRVAASRPGAQLTEAGEIDRAALDAWIKTAIGEEQTYIDSISESSGVPIQGMGGQADAATLEESKARTDKALAEILGGTA